MRAKLTVLVAIAALLVAAAAAHGAITVALYRFSAEGDVRSFYKVQGKNCKRKWRKQKALGVSAGERTKRCVWRSSVVGDSSDPGPDQEMAASTNLAAKTPVKKRPKIYLGVAVRQNAETGYELRVRPVARKWQLLRDPRGNGKPTVIAGGTGRFIRQGVGKGNVLTLRAFDYGTSRVSLLAKVNNKKVYAKKDAGADLPNGRRTVLTFGAVGKASANRAVGSFDNVAIRVPNPF